LDLLRLLDLRIGRWLAYADTCLNAETESVRCQGFWTFVAAVLGIICVLALAGGAIKYVMDRRKGGLERGKARYRKSA
jgi:hypothetical protein